MVASLTNGSHNEWADAAVEYQKEHYPKMTLLEENPRVEQMIMETQHTMQQKN